MSKRTSHLSSGARAICRENGVPRLPDPGAVVMRAFDEATLFAAEIENQTNVVHEYEANDHLAGRLFAYSFDGWSPAAVRAVVMAYVNNAPAELLAEFAAIAAEEIDNLVCMREEREDESRAA